MRISRKTSRATAIGVAGVVMTLSTAGLAAASASEDSFSDCPAQLMCVFGGTNGATATGWRIFGPTSPGSCNGFVITSIFGARGALSAYNLTNRTQKLYQGFDCTGAPVRLGPGGAIANLGSFYHSIGG